MSLISSQHVLLQSKESFTIIALPLIPTAVDCPDTTLSESAIVFSLERKNNNRIICASEEAIVVEWLGEIQIGKLRSLPEEIDDLIINKSAYR